MYGFYFKKGIIDRIVDYVNILLILLMVFIMIYPFVNQLALSLNEGADSARGGIYFFPRKFTLESYVFMFNNSKLLSGALISVLRVVVGTITCLALTGLLSYIVTIRSFSGRRFMRIIFLITLYFGGGLIPFYLLIVRLNMINTFTVYWLPGMINDYYMLIISSYMQNLPESLSESARIDGCMELLIYVKIIFPMSIPVFAAIAVFSAVEHWNSWFDCLIFNPGGKWDTLQVILRKLLLELEILEKNRGQEAAKYRSLTSVSVRAATSMVVSLPIILVYPFFQRYFISGITIGAVKG